ncbi:excalibur calcium-binding domain-containing protein [Streptomyces chumphonensis]|uniref:excalibur calcium-binding domain-containing protein n=1 Tax=Streptomyces chumphonensis TaxID=1214925 RepID=UPI002964E313|nr:LAETG motif-containing sortase-dependent surface protein [Streptomyces chumphonensis]
MKLKNSLGVAAGAVVLAVLPTTAQAHDGNHPFTNCTEAYESGHANIPRGDEHYGSHLDRDRDGIGCDQPPSGFVPVEEQVVVEDTTEPTSAPEEPTGGEGAEDATELAETGGDDDTPYLVGGGAAVLLAGAGLVALGRRRAKG